MPAAGLLVEAPMCDKGTVMPRRGGECVVLWAVAEPMPWRRGSWMMSSRVNQWEIREGLGGYCQLPR